MHVIVHVGPHKTGTTAIQKALHESRGALENIGMCPRYVGIGQIRDLSLRYSPPREINFPTVLARYGSAENARAWSESCWVSLSKEIMSSAAPFYVLSSEHFSDIASFGEFFQRLRDISTKITVILYVRDPVDIYLSALQQNIKGGRNPSLRRLPTEYVFPYGRFLPAIIDQIGQENVVIRNFDRENLYKGDVVADFFHFLGGFSNAPEVLGERSNEALPGAALSWLVREDARQGAAFDHEKRRRVVARMLRSADVLGLPRLRLPNADWEMAIRVRSRATCSWINRDFLQNQVPIPIPNADIVEPALSPAATLKKDMQAWLESYLTPEADNLINYSIGRVGVGNS
ncbi:MAG: hypothetical protein ACOH2H_16780 [Cypionkella sp.]